ncbi:MAG: hypothetical protein ABII88_04020 [Candidatus Omnitrophota bacterium]
MFKKMFVLCAVVLCLGITFNAAFAQSASTTITGTVEAIAEDGSSITVSGKVIMIPEDFEYSVDLEEGDEIEVIVNTTEEGLVAVDYNYL